MKYGPPTVTCRFVTASTNSGKIVPSSTMNVTTSSTTLFPRNTLSRESAESNEPSARSVCRRSAMSPNPPSSTSVRNPRYIGPTADWANVWTEDRMLPRVRNVPNVVSANAPTISERFQTFSMPRRSWTITECRNAVAISHGSSATFSTGSHAQ